MYLVVVQASLLPQQEDLVSAFAPQGAGVQMRVVHGLYQTGRLQALTDVSTYRTSRLRVDLLSDCMGSGSKVELEVEPLDTRGVGSTRKANLLLPVWRLPSA